MTTRTIRQPAPDQITQDVWYQLGYCKWLDPFRRACKAIQPEQAEQVLPRFYEAARHGRVMQRRFVREDVPQRGGDFRKADWNWLYQNGLELPAMKLIGYVKAMPDDRISLAHKEEEASWLWMEQNRVQAEMPLTYIPTPSAMFTFVSPEDYVPLMRLEPSITRAEAIEQLMSKPRSMATFIAREDIEAETGLDDIPYDAQGDMRNYYVMHTAAGRVIAQGHSYDHNKNHSKRETQFFTYTSMIAEALNDPVLVVERVYASRTAFDQYMRQMSKSNRVTQFGMGYGSARYPSKGFTESVEWGAKAVQDAEAKGEFLIRFR